MKDFAIMFGRPSIGYIPIFVEIGVETECRRDSECIKGEKGVVEKKEEWHVSGSDIGFFVL